MELELLRRRVRLSMYWFGRGNAQSHFVVRIEECSFPCFISYVYSSTEYLEWFLEAEGLHMDVHAEPLGATRHARSLACIQHAASIFDTLGSVS